MAQINFTQDAQGGIYGYDSDDASQSLAQQRLANGHKLYVPQQPSTAQLLAQAQQAQAAAVGAACAAAITGGFTSSALGKAYTYPSQQTDQANLASNVLSSMYPGLPANWTTPHLCADSNGVWDYRPHTAAQIQQVGTDGKAAILACLTKNATLQAQIKAAPDVASVQQIVW